MSIQLAVGKDQQGNALLMVTLSVPIPVPGLLTLLKRGAPEAWKEAERELVLPDNPLPMNGETKL